MYKASLYPEIDRSLGLSEFNEVIQMAEQLGLHRGLSKRHLMKVQFLVSLSSDSAFTKSTKSSNTVLTTMVGACEDNLRNLIRDLFSYRLLTVILDSA